MLCLKKVYSDNLLQLALILSLLKVDPGYYLGFGPRSWGYGSFESGNTTSWFVDSPNILRSQQVHPKSLDNVLLNYERQVFEDLNSLGRYNRIGSHIHNSNITAYLLNIGDSVVPTNSEASEDSETSSTSPQNDTRDDSDDLWSEVVSPLADVAEAISTAELTQEDMDLIEVLWKQDVDLGFSLAEAENNPTDYGRKSSADSPETSSSNVYLSDIKLTEKPVIPTNSTLPSRSSSNIDDDVEKLKALEALKSEDVAESGDVLGDPWAGLSYTVDTETGEYVLKGGLGDALPVADSDTSLPPLDLPLPLPEFLLEELELCGLNEDCPREAANPKDVERPEDSPSEDSGGSSSGSVSGAGGGTASAEGIKDPLDSDEELEIFSEMIQTAQFHPSHPRPFHQSHMPFVRTMSMEQRWQDLANLLSLPPGDAANAAAAAAGMNANAAVHHAHAAAFSHHAHAHAAHHAAHHAAALHNYSTHGHPHPHHTAHPMSYTSDARGVLLHNASLAPPMGDLNVTSPYNNIAGAGTNLGNAVATSMNLTNSSEPMGDAGSTPHYKMESSHDMMYYPNSSSEIGNTTDGFLSSILNDEDLQLMDMAMSEGMYTMRMLDGGGSPASGNGRDLATAVDRGADASSDSAVSSMGSERVPSLSDGEWCDAASDSGHTTADHYPLEYHAGNAYCSKYRPYDYSYSTRQHTNSLVGSDVSRRVPTVAQKKHQMFGKRFFQEQGANALTQPTTSVKYEYPEPSSANTYGTPSTNPMLDDSSLAKPPELKYSCTMEFGRHVHSGRSVLEHAQHNHTYHLPAESTGAMQRPVSRDKLKGRKSEDEPHLTRDEKRARALNVPIAVDDIINLPMDEFNERLSKYDLTEPQLSLIRDIRRRGKNKVAAQNCRKRKLDQILSLADEVKDMRDRKNRLINERDFIVAERQRVKEKFAQLYRHVFQNLRDADGNPYSSTLYSLQQSADGSVLVVPRANASMIPPEQKDQHNNQKE